MIWDVVRCPTNNPKCSNVEKNMSNQMWISEYFHELLFCFMQMHTSTYCRWPNTLVFSQVTAGGDGRRCCKDSWEDDWEQVNININTREFEGGLRGRSLKGRVFFRCTPTQMYLSGWECYMNLGWSFEFNFECCFPCFSSGCTYESDCDGLYGQHHHSELGHSPGPHWPLQGHLHISLRRH